VEGGTNDVSGYTGRNSVILSFQDGGRPGFFQCPKNRGLGSVPIRPFVGGLFPFLPFHGSPLGRLFFFGWKFFPPPTTGQCPGSLFFFFSFSPTLCAFSQSISHPPFCWSFASQGELLFAIFQSPCSPLIRSNAFKDHPFFFHVLFVRCSFLGERFEDSPSHLSTLLNGPVVYRIPFLARCP